MKVNISETELWPLYCIRSAEGLPTLENERHMVLPDELVERHARAVEALEQAQSEIRQAIFDAGYRM